MESASTKDKIRKVIVYIILIVMAFIMLVTVVMQRAEKRFVFYN